MQIPFYGLDNLYNKYKSCFDDIALKTLASGQYFNEDIIGSLEATIAQKCNRKYAITIGSCTDALFFALETLGVNKGDKVIVPAVSFIATVTPVFRAGAIPVFADIDPANGLICPLHLEKLLQQHEIKAVIGVDLFGNMIDPSLVSRLEQTYHVPFIEDAAQSLGSVRDSSVAGSLGKISCLSFDPTKVIHAFGSGGAVLTDDEEIAERIKRLRYHGKSGKEYVEHGYNSRINSLQAGLLNFQLEHLDEIIESRNQTGKKYEQAISGKKSLRCMSSPNSICNHHKFVILADDRDDLKLFLEKRGIQTMIHYPCPLYSYELFRQNPFIADGITAAQPFCDTVLTLPLHTFMKAEDLTYICNTLQQIP
jgi:dTDP-4-amino-4,6-dideoxygalactose transaminase